MSTIEKRIQKILRTVTRARDVNVTTSADGSLQAAIQLKAQTVKFRVLWAGEGWPEDVRRVLPKGSAARDPELVVLARRLAPGSLKILGGLGVNWADETGAAFIDGERLVVMRDGSKELPSTSSSQAGGFEWSNSAVDIAETILSFEDDAPLRINDISESTSWSVPQVSNVLRAFERQGWVQSTGAERGKSARRILADRYGLINSWAEGIAEKPAERLIAHALTQDLMGFLRRELMPRLNQHARWAVTGWAGGELLAPFASVVPVLQIYVDEANFGPDLIRSVGLTPVDEGGSIEFWSAGHVALMLASRTDDQLLVASPARVFADLKSLGERGEEAANHLLALELESESQESTRAEPDAAALDELRAWEQSSRDLLTQQINELEPDQRSAQHQYGTWTAAYKLHEFKSQPDKTDLRDALKLIGDSESQNDSDFWQSNPNGSLFLMRDFEEDSPRAASDPGKTLSLTLPIWRTGECLMHSRRLAEALGAGRIDFMMRWEGLRGRELSALPSRDRSVPPGRRSTQNVVSATVRTTPAEVQLNLPSVVRALVEPLYTAFDFFRPPESIYGEELGRMHERTR